jgi:hypothetical protein
MKDSILIFDLGGGFTNMLMHLASILCFTKNNGYKFTIRWCTARPQDIDKQHSLNSAVDKRTGKKVYNMYEVMNLFDEATFFVHDNYISYSSLEEDLCNGDVYDFYEKYKVINTQNELSKNHIKEVVINEINMSSSKYIIMGPNVSILPNSDYHPIFNTKAFRNTLVPSQIVVDEYNKIIQNIGSQYNFLHYRHETDMKKYSIMVCGEYFVPKIDDILRANLYKNNELKTYIATSVIETLHEKNLMDKPLDQYNDICYKLHTTLPHFDENAFVDYLIELNSAEIFGFNASSFSYSLNQLKHTQNYYNKEPFKSKIENVIRE